MENVTEEKLKSMNLGEIATLIKQDWRKASPRGINPAALHYIDALETLNVMTDSYGLDPAHQIVNYMLGNCQHWQGPTARMVKAELNKRVKDHYKQR